MTQKNLLLTEKAIKAHSKRLQKELKNLNQDLSLTHVQNLLSKTFGFNNFHELKEILFKEKKTEYSPINIVKHFQYNLEKEEIFIYIKPTKKMSNKFQNQLKEYITNIKLGWKEQKIDYSEIKINQDYLIIYLDPKSDFSDLVDLKQWGIKLHDLLDLLTNKIYHYLSKNKIVDLDNMEYGYNIFRENRICVHLENLLQN